jgi:ADP-heptose:LPS heptosyltransferase
MSKPRAVVLRWASIGDAIQVSSPIAELHDAGYHVTLVTSKDGETVLRHDPNIDVIDTSKGGAADGNYGKWMDGLCEGFDHVCNLNYAVEGEIAAEPMNPNYYWPEHARRSILGSVNYVERQHMLAGVPYRRNRQWFFETPKEEAEAKESLRSAITVGIALCGSHRFKSWTDLPEFCAILLRKHRVRLVLLGGFDARELAIQEYLMRALEAEFGSRDSDEFEVMSCISTPMRTSLALACHVDILIGSDTGLLNAAAMRPNHKIVLLTHNTPANLTRDWRNTVALQSAAPCSPCLRLRHRDGDCPQVDFEPACVQAFSVDNVLRETERAISDLEVSASRPAGARRGHQAIPISRPAPYCETAQRLHAYRVGRGI